jgi:hypothetical protein
MDELGSVWSPGFMGFSGECRLAKAVQLGLYCDPGWVGLNRDETLQDLSRDSARSCEDFLPSTLLHIM